MFCFSKKRNKIFKNRFITKTVVYTTPLSYELQLYYDRWNALAKKQGTVRTFRNQKEVKQSKV